MSFTELCRTRQSIRLYESRPVDPELVRQVLEAGRMAPTACNNQPLHFIVCETGSQVARLKPAYDRAWFLASPVVIVVCCDHHHSWVRQSDGRDYGMVDAAIAMDHMILAATELGLGSCWIAAFDPLELRKALDLPEHVEPVAMTPLGYAAQQVAPRGRKSLLELVHRGTF